MGFNGTTTCKVSKMKLLKQIISDSYQTSGAAGAGSGIVVSAFAAASTSAGVPVAVASLHIQPVSKSYTFNGFQWVSMAQPPAKCLKLKKIKQTISHRYQTSGAAGAGSGTAGAASTSAGVPAALASSHIQPVSKSYNILNGLQWVSMAQPPAKCLKLKTLKTDHIPSLSNLRSCRGRQWDRRDSICGGALAHPTVTKSV